MEIIVLKFK